MPIPFLLGGIALLAAGYGAKKGVDALDAMDTAKSLIKESQRLERNARNTLNNKIKKCQASVNKLGELKLSIMEKEMTDFVDAYGRLRNVNLTELENEDLLDFAPQDEHFKALQQTVLQAKDVATGAGAGLAGGLAAAAGAYGAVGVLGTASTGAAISGLSGVAATNATLAWLGGGSLATGGLGVAGGTLVLGGLVAAPAIMIGGVILNNKAEKALADAKTFQKKAERCKAEYENKGSYYQAVGTRAEQICLCLFKLIALFDGQLKEMKETVNSVGTDWRTYFPENKDVVIQTAILAKGIRELLDVPLIYEDGRLTEESELALEKAEGLLEE